MTGRLHLYCYFWSVRALACLMGQREANVQLRKHNPLLVG